MDNDTEVSLPKATLQKMIKDNMPSDVRVASDAVEMMIECCTEFIQLVSSESNEVATKESKSTIHPEHVIRALTELGFPEFVGEVNQSWDQYKQEAKATNNQKANLRKTGAEQAGLTEEQQIALQQQMFAAARARSLTSAENAASLQAMYQAQLAAVNQQPSNSGVPGITALTPLPSTSAPVPPAATMLSAPPAPALPAPADSTWPGLMPAAAAHAAQASPSSCQQPPASTGPG